MSPRWLLPLLLLGACKPDDDSCGLDGDLTPGCGLLMDDQPLRLGDSLDAVVELHGEPVRTDLGSAGTRFDYPGFGVTGFADAEGTVVSLMVTPLYDGSTAEGMGPGTNEDQIEARLGSAMRDPYSGVLHYPERGVSFEAEAGVVTRVHLWPMQKEW